MYLSYCPSVNKYRSQNSSIQQLPFEPIFSVSKQYHSGVFGNTYSLNPTVFKGFIIVIYLLLLLQLNMSIDFILYKWHKIKVFVIGFSLIIHFISIYPIFCKHIASIKLFLNFPIIQLVRTYLLYISIFPKNPILFLIATVRNTWIKKWKSKFSYEITE